VDPTLRLLCDLVAIDSVNPTLVPGAAGEGAIAEAIATAMRGLSLDVSVEPVAAGRPNVVGVLEGRVPGRTLMFCGHTDTVGVAGMSHPFTPTMRGGRLYGRGSQDMKGGLAAMIAAAGVLATRGFPAGRIIVAAVVDEEHSSIGADALVARLPAGVRGAAGARRWPVHAAVVTEPTDLTIAIGHKGFEWVEILVEGKAAHGSRPAEGQDAILRMGRVLARLEALDRELQRGPRHPLMGTRSLHASTIAGGREWSSYPDAAVLQVERRTLPGESLTAGIQEVEEICGGLQREDTTFRTRARQVFSRGGYEIQQDHELPRALSASLERVGGTPTMSGASFWTDAAVLDQAGIPSVLFGPGGAGLHSEEEYVIVDDVLRCRDALVDLASRFC